MEKSTAYKNSKKESGKKSFSRWVKTLSTPNKLVVVIVLIIFVLSFEMANFYFGVKILGGIRSWVAAEDYWTHQQKTAHYILQEYVISHNESEYDQIAGYLNAYYGDRNARLEMEKPNMNYTYVAQQFISGGINPGDNDNTIFLFRYFRFTPWISQAVVYWEDADTRIQAFMAISQQIHTLIVTPLPNNNPLAESQRDAKVAALLQQENVSDNKATIDENNFAEVLGEGSRAIQTILLLEAGFFNVLLGFLAILTAIFIAKITIQAENEKNDFMRIANHQLNTPLSIMKNAYAMVESGSLDSGEGLRYMGSGLTRMIAVFEDIKIILQLEGEVKYDIRKNDITVALAQAAEYAKRAVITNKKDIEVIIKKPDFEIPKVLCDIRQINNAIYNLLDNAVYYTAAGAIEITYQLIANKYLKINIRDRGIGFSEEEKEKFGQKFYRSKKALLVHPDGSGLGLYICKKIIESNNGQFFFESEGEGKGSTFSFTLPVAR